MTRSACWCGHAPLLPFDAQYLRCPSCETLLLDQLPGDVDQVVDEVGLYGRDYWFGHQAEMGLPDVVARARLDFGDRLVPWLQSLLRHRLPPARTLELGSSHGGFVALLRAAGFDATGLELSPSVAALARELFDVPVLVGTIESHALTPGSLDAVIAMDVLEHLADPVSTTQAVANALAPDGLVMFQTPAYPAGQSLEQLREAAHPFLSMLLPGEHTYLFSRQAIALLLKRAGLDHIVFEPAVFDHYDMLVLASRRPLTALAVETQEQALLSTPRGRLVQALVDRTVAVRELQAAVARRQAEHEAMAKALADAEADRAARLAVIEEQGTDLGIARSRWQESEAIRRDLEGHLAAAEADRQARLAVLEQQGAELGDALARAGALAERAQALEAHLAASEADRAARLVVIEQQGARLSHLEACEAEVASLSQRLVIAEADREARLRVIEDQGAQLGQLSSDLAACQARVAEYEGHVAAYEGRVAAYEGRVAAYEGRVAAYEGRVAAYEGRVAADEARIARYEARVAALQAWIDLAAHSRPGRALRRIGVLPDPPGEDMS